MRERLIELLMMEHDWPEGAAEEIADEVLAIPVPMRLPCPSCGALHLDEGEFASKPHHTHACQICGMVWRPAILATVGVQFLPGFKDEGQATTDSERSGSD